MRIFKKEKKNTSAETNHRVNYFYDNILFYIIIILVVLILDFIINGDYPLKIFFESILNLEELNILK